LIVFALARRPALATDFAAFAVSPLTLAAIARLARFGTLALFATFAWFALFSAIAVVFTAFARFTGLSASLTALPVTVATIARAASARAALIVTLTIGLLRLLVLRVVAFGLIGAGGDLTILAPIGIRFLATLFVAIHLVFVAIVLLRRRLRRLHHADQTEIVVGVLEVVFAKHPITRARGITRELEVAFENHRGWAADFCLGTIAFKRAVGILVSATTAAMVSTTAATVIAVPAATWPTATTPLTLH